MRGFNSCGNISASPPRSRKQQKSPFFFLSSIVARFETKNLVFFTSSSGRVRLAFELCYSLGQCVNYSTGTATTEKLVRYYTT